MSHHGASCVLAALHLQPVIITLMGTPLQRNSAQHAVIIDHLDVRTVQCAITVLTNLITTVHGLETVLDAEIIGPSIFSSCQQHCFAFG